MTLDGSACGEDEHGHMKRHGHRSTSYRTGQHDIKISRGNRLQIINNVHASLHTIEHTAYSPYREEKGGPVRRSRGRDGSSWRKCSDGGRHTSHHSARPKPLDVKSVALESPSFNKLESVLLLCSLTVSSQSLSGNVSIRDHSWTFINLLSKSTSQSASTEIMNHVLI